MEEKFMIEALKEAKKAQRLDEVPVGAVIVKNNKIIARAYNRKESNNCCFDHAEMIAIKKANKKVKNWRLEGCTMYVTLEPCQMCQGAIIESRMDGVIYGCKKNKKQMFDTKVKVINKKNINSECEKILKDFFSKKRK